MGAGLQRAWLRRGPLACALWPVSLLYRIVAALHRGLYAAGVLRTERLPVPVIVVGNVVAGGAGKTPVVVALVEHLLARGLAVGVISRGYGRGSDACVEVAEADEAARTGDEPLLVKRKTGVPVFVAALRADAARALLAAYPGTQVIVSDDGLQHHALARDIEICVFDARGIGNGWLLPAGPLREPWPRPADFVLHHGHPCGIEGHAIQRGLAQEAWRANGTRIALADLRGQPLHAVAGIAQPESFFAMLRGAGLSLAATEALPDHHQFDAAWGARTETLVCTEKDAVKLWRLRPDAWAVPLELQVPQAFWDALTRTLAAKLSSPHGSSPA
jgi:tetraacyldisaccharide 4'-kinase